MLPVHLHLIWAVAVSTASELVTSAWPLPMLLTSSRSDVVCQFEGDRHARLRLLRAVKNRYGPTDEVGCFDLGERGIVGLEDPSGLFLSSERSQVPGTCATVTLEGRRPVPVEVQALVAPTAAASPRRTTSGVDHSRVAMSLTVLAARLRLDTSNADVYVSTVGGARAVEPFL